MSEFISLGYFYVIVKFSLLFLLLSFEMKSQFSVELFYHRSKVENLVVDIKIVVNVGWNLMKIHEI